MRKLVTPIGLAFIFLSALVWALSAQARPSMPLGRHCGAVGPLPPDFCGCTWGPVFFRGQRVPSATVTLAFGNSITTGFTLPGPEETFPYYGLEADELGARKGDLMTLTAHFAGQIVTRTIRAWPEPGPDHEQYVALAFPEGFWNPWVTGGYTRALALAGNVLWAGGPAGVISISLTSGISVVHTLPWANPSVRALAVVTDGHVWAAGAGGVAEFDGALWRTHAVPFSGAVLALTVDPVTGAIWAGGGDGNQGRVAVYTGAWEAAGVFSSTVMALAADLTTGHISAGTWEDGVYRQDGSGGWTHHSRMPGGLASNRVLAAVATGDAVWFGTEPCLSTDGPCGGISRYDLATGAWRTYTTAHGLPADAGLAPAPAPVYTLARSESDTVWAGMGDGIRFQADENWWAAYTTTYGLRPGTVSAIAIGNGTALAALPAGLDRLDPDAASGALPTATISSISPLTLTFPMTLTLVGGGQDHDEDGARVVGWDWSSSVDGPLCTSAGCELSYGLFTPGRHDLALRVQDDEGVWSTPVTATVVVKEPRRVYLPAVLTP